jgi:hypothetical protein
MTDDQTRRDDRYGQLLLSPLRGEPTTPSRVDLARAMTEGRRRRVRWWAGGAAIVALTGAAAGGGTLVVGALDGPLPKPAPHIVATPSPTVSWVEPPAGPTACTLTRLPTDGAPTAMVTGGDPSGRYLVGMVYNSDRPVIVWKDGRIVTRTTMPGTSKRNLHDLNRSGVGIATSTAADHTERSYVYRDGRFTLLKGGASDAVAINDAGAIAGDLGSRPAVWSSPTAAPVRLKLPAGTTTGAVRGIDEDGTVLGEVGRPNTDATGYLWLPDGTGHKMPLPNYNGKPANYFWPYSISNGWIIGSAVVDVPHSERLFLRYRYQIATNHYQALPEDAGMPYGVAANGWVAGLAVRVTIYSDYHVLALPNYGSDRDHYVSSFSADGRVIGGYSLGPNLTSRPLMWRCR